MAQSQAGGDAPADAMASMMLPMMMLLGMMILLILNYIKEGLLLLRNILGPETRNLLMNSKGFIDIGYMVQNFQIMNMHL